MRELTVYEMEMVSGGWGTWGTWYRTRSYTCQPKPVCQPQPVCEPKPPCGETGPIPN